MSEGKTCGADGGGFYDFVRVSIDLEDADGIVPWAPLACINARACYAVRSRARRESRSAGVGAVGAECHAVLAKAPLVVIGGGGPLLVLGTGALLPWLGDSAGIPRLPSARTAVAALTAVIRSQTACCSEPTVLRYVLSNARRSVPGR